MTQNFQVGKKIILLLSTSRYLDFVHVITFHNKYYLFTTFDYLYLYYLIYSLFIYCKFCLNLFSEQEKSLSSFGVFYQMAVMRIGVSMNSSLLNRNVSNHHSFIIHLFKTVTNVTIQQNVLGKHCYNVGKQLAMLALRYYSIS